MKVRQLLVGLGAKVAAWVAAASVAVAANAADPLSRDHPITPPSREILVVQKSDALEGDPTVADDIPDAGTLSSGSVNPAAGQNWVVSCTNAGADGTMNCSMTQTLVIRETGQRLLAIALRKAASEAGAAMMITMPHGLFLPAGVEIKIDDGPGSQHPVQTCDQGGCYVGLPVDDALLEALRAGTQFVVSFQNTRKEILNIPATLVGFEQSWELMH